MRDTLGAHGEVYYVPDLKRTKQRPKSLVVGSIDGGGMEGYQNVACDFVYAEEIKGLEGLFLTV